MTVDCLCISSSHCLELSVSYYCEAVRAHLEMRHSASVPPPHRYYGYNVAAGKRLVGLIRPVELESSLRERGHFLSHPVA